jgi:hypothetical protein
MTFRPILLFLFCFQTTGTTPLDHFQLTILDAHAVAARTITVVKQSTDQENNVQKRSHASHKRAKQDAQMQTLMGTVEWEYKPLAWDCDVPNCDHFALYEDATHTNYELDDAHAALPYE